MFEHSSVLGNPASVGLQSDLLDILAQARK